MDDRRRLVPGTDTVLADPRIAAETARLGAGLVKDTVRAVLQECRDGTVPLDGVVESVLAALPRWATKLRPVVNATGVIVHTNLGRAPLSTAAREAVAVAAGATDIELDLDSGRRGRRGASVLQALSRVVPAAESIHVVNNGAAALALAARTLAADGNIVVSRGEMVEIGDGFRIPELIESLGVDVRDVGTTNRVRLDDYAQAIDGNTGFVLKVHTSNFAVQGFTSAVDTSELASLPVPVVADIGSGLLQPHRQLPDEPDAASALVAGASVVTASGDKLLGGPQCGLLFGTNELIERLRRYPFARAVRVDKLTLAALEATVTGVTTPVQNALHRTRADLCARARHISQNLPTALGAEVADSQAAVGGGGAPGVTFESAAVALPADLAKPLRTASRPVMGYVAQNRLLIDLMAVDPADDQIIIDTICGLPANGRGAQA